MLNIALITTTILLAIFSFALGIFSLYRNPKAKVARLWFLMSLAVVIWSLAYLFTVLVADPQTGAITIRVLYFGASLIPILYFHFVASFLLKDISRRFLLILGYVLAFIFLALNIFTNLVIRGVRYLPGLGYYEDIALPGFILFLVYFAFFVLYAIILLIKGYNQSEGMMRRKIFWILAASVVGFIGGGSNFLTDLTGIYPYGQFVVWLYPLFITYGIFVDEIQIKIKF